MGKIVAVIFSFVGIGTVFYGVSIIAQHYFQQQEQFHELWTATEKHRRALVCVPSKERFNQMMSGFKKKSLLIDWWRSLVPLSPSARYQYQ